MPLGIVALKRRGKKPKPKPALTVAAVYEYADGLTVIGFGGIGLGLELFLWRDDGSAQWIDAVQGLVLLDVAIGLA